MKEDAVPDHVSMSDILQSSITIVLDFLLYLVYWAIFSLAIGAISYLYEGIPLDLKTLLDFLQAFGSFFLIVLGSLSIFLTLLNQLAVKKLLNGIGVSFWHRYCFTRSEIERLKQEASGKE